MTRSEDEASRRAAWLIFLWLFCSYAFFFQGGGWNPNSRLDLTRAVAEEGRIQIDAYRQNTDDWAKRGEHYYANKAPGLSILAVPAYVLGDATAAAFGLSASPRLRVAGYTANLLANALPAAGLGVLFFLCSAWLGIEHLPFRIAATLSLSLGTLLWPYATAYYAHTPAAAAAGVCA